MLRWADPFDQYGAKARMLEGVGGGAAWSQVDGNWSLSAANPATGAYHMRLTEDVGGASILMRRALGQSKQVSAIGYRFQVDDLPSIEATNEADEYLMMVGFRDVANAAQIRVNLGTEGSVRALRGNTELYRSDPVIAAGGYHHFEAKAKIDNAAGYLEVRVNEVTVLNLPGIDTQSTANAECSQFAFGQRGDVLDAGPGFGLFDVDDCFAWDDDASDPENTVVDFVGDKGAYWRAVDADTATADWVPSTGVSGYPLLDEVPPDGADYVSDATGAARSIFSLAPLPDNVAEVIAIIPVIYGRKEEAGAVTMHGGLVVDGDESVGPDDSPATEFAYLRSAPKTIDPSTGVAWANTAEPQLLIERTA